MEISEFTSTNKFYKDAAKYWEKIPATVDGMLGGFGFISNTEIQDSKLFLKSLFKLPQPPGKSYALDCGAGIGRVTKYLLSTVFKKVDLVEQNPQFLESAKLYLQDSQGKIGDYYAIGLQDFPFTKKYDVIWCQWVLAHLNDEDLKTFLQKCINGLNENGMIIVKENVTNSLSPQVDKVDSSCTRPCDTLEKIFKIAGLLCVKKKLQNKMPRGLFPVYMFALKPKKSENNEQQRSEKSEPSENTEI